MKHNANTLAHLKEIYRAGANNNERDSKRDAFPCCVKWVSIHFRIRLENLRFFCVHCCASTKYNVQFVSRLSRISLFSFFTFARREFFVTFHCFAMLFVQLKRLPPQVVCHCSFNKTVCNTSYRLWLFSSALYNCMLAKAIFFRAATVNCFEIVASLIICYNALYVCYALFLLVLYTYVSSDCIVIRLHSDFDAQFFKGSFSFPFHFIALALGIAIFTPTRTFNDYPHYTQFI